MKKQRSQIKAGMVLSYLNIGLGNLISVFYLPIMLSLLGQSEYGLYKLATSITTYLSLLIFGIGGSITRYVLKANLEGGHEAEERIFGLFNVIFSVISVLAIVVGLIITLNIDVLYAESLSADELVTMRILLGIMVLNTAVTISSTPYTTVVSTHERFIFVQLMTVLTTTMVPVCNVIMLLFGFRSIGMAISTLALTVIVRIAYLIYVKRSLNLKPRYKNMPVHMIKEILVFSFWIFVANLTTQLFGTTDTVIIGATPALAAIGVTIYSVGHQFSTILISLSHVIPNLFMPRANKMVLSGKNEKELTDFTIQVGRVQAYFVALFCFGFVAFGRQFLQIYVGSGYDEAYWVAVIIMIPNCIQLVQSVFISIMQAKNMHSFRAKTYTFIALANAVATVFLVRVFGVIGAAIPTALCYLIGNGFLMNWFYRKKMKMEVPRFWKQIIPVFVPSILLSAVTLIVSIWVDFSSLLMFIIGVVVFTALYCLICWKIVMNKEEKGLILQQIRRFKRKKQPTSNE